MSTTLTISLIVRNEEQSLGRCLDSVQGLGDEIVVVDTGSTDGTREVAAGRGARVFDFPWCDDFAAARNETLRFDSDDRTRLQNSRRRRRGSHSGGHKLARSLSP